MEWVWASAIYVAMVRSIPPVLSSAYLAYYSKLKPQLRAERLLFMHRDLKDA